MLHLNMRDIVEKKGLIENKIKANWVKRHASIMLHLNMKNIVGKKVLFIK